MRLCLSDSCPTYVRSSCRAEYRDDITTCATCGQTLTAVTDEEADRHHQPPTSVRSQAVLRVVAIALSLCGALYLVALLLPSDVHFVNGLDEPITITLGDGKAPIQLTPRGHDKRSLAGKIHVVVRGRQTLLSDEWIDVPRSTDLVLYNVLGAANLCLTQHTYIADGVAASHPARMFGGPIVTRLRDRRLVIEDDVRDIFSPAPASIQVPKRDAGSSKKRGQLDFCP